MRLDRGFARVLLLLLLIMQSGETVAKQDLRIIFSQYTPPYVFENGSGIVVDIVRTALADAGYSITPVYVPIGRGFKMFANRQVDGTTIIRESSGLPAEYSDDFMQYHNRVFALKSRGLSIRSFADLQDKSVIAFQNAHRYLGADFGRAAANNPRYGEMARQEAQVRMLLLRRTDVVVMDEGIFRFYWRKFEAETQGKEAREFVTFDLFPPTAYKAAFTDRRVRDAFNRGIAVMRRDGRYDAIYRRYADEHLSIRQ